MAFGLGQDMPYGAAYCYSAELQAFRMAACITPKLQ